MNITLKCNGVHVEHSEDSDAKLKVSIMEAEENCLNSEDVASCIHPVVYLRDLGHEQAAFHLNSDAMIAELTTRGYSVGRG